MQAAQKEAIVVLISGRGSNLRALHRGGRDYRIAAVISDNPQAAGLAFAKEVAIPSVVLPRVAASQRDQYTAALIDAIKAYNPSWIALAGFMQIIRPPLLSAFSDRVINIHPALLPAFPGLDTHARALAAGVREHGCTVHFVDSGVDTGPIIAQASVSVKPDMSVEQLSAAVLDCEHMLYPWVVNNLANHTIRFAKGVLAVDQSVRIQAQTKGIRLAS